MKLLILFSALLLGCVGTRDKEMLDKEEQEQHERQEQEEKLDQQERDVIYRQTGS